MSRKNFIARKSTTYKVSDIKNSILYWMCAVNHKLEGQLLLASLSSSLLSGGWFLGDLSIEIKDAWLCLMIISYTAVHRVRIP